MHEENIEDVVVCERCSASSNIMRIFAIVNIQQREWFLLEFYCAECNNTWMCWDREFPIAGDIMYKVPYTWMLIPAAK